MKIKKRPLLLIERYPIKRSKCKFEINVNGTVCVLIPKELRYLFDNTCVLSRGPNGLIVLFDVLRFEKYMDSLDYSYANENKKKVGEKVKNKSKIADRLHRLWGETLQDSFELENGWLVFEKDYWMEFENKKSGYIDLALSFDNNRAPLNWVITFDIDILNNN